jgi:methanogen homocitrate synthase
MRRNQMELDRNYEGLSLENVPYYQKDRFWLSPMDYLPETYDISQAPAKVLIHDVTLRDGEQTPGVVFKLDERIKIAQILSELGVDRIEFGMPLVSKDIYEAFKVVLTMNLKAEIVAFLRAHKDDLKSAISLGVKSVIIEHVTNPYLCKYVYKLDHAGTVNRIVDAFKIAKDNGLKAYFMGWDASRAGLPYLKRLYSDILDKVVPESIIFVDTFGVMTPWAVGYTLKTLREWFPKMKFEIHNHNGFGLGIANALAAVRSGASCVHTSLLGLGERDGNLAIDEVAMALEIMMKVKTNIDLSQLARVTQLAEQISRFKTAGTKPITGDFYFKMEPGVTIHAVEMAQQAGLGSRCIIGAFAPEVIGKKGYEYILGKESGIRIIKIFLDRLGLKATEEQMKEMLEIVKEESNIVKGNISESEFEHIARGVLNKKG